jgi:hypothetical protein
MEHKIILPSSFYQMEDQPDPAFVQRLKHIDSKLLVYWNRFRGRWVIDRHTCDCLGDSHSHSCPRVNVRLVQTEDGDYHPLNDRVLDDLRASDTWSQGLTPESINARLDIAKAAYDASRDEDLKHIVSEGIHDDHMHHDSAFPAVPGIR